MDSCECIICLSYNDDEDLINNSSCSCKYIYHQSCMNVWLKHKNNCIICKKSFNKQQTLLFNENIMPLQSYMIDNINVSMYNLLRIMSGQGDLSQSN